MDAEDHRAKAPENNRFESPTAASLGRFKKNLDELLTRNPGPEARINALLDLFGTRCATANELRLAGEAVFAALNSARCRSAVLGRYHERFLFCRAGDDVELGAEGQRLATLKLDEAIRLATLLHGAPHTTLHRQRAA
ncbi:MAG: hypothetical protein PVF93_00590 [Chromatiaceae bacterium]|jgi:hypothetical protein